MDLNSLRLRVSPWLCFALGAIFILWALLERKGGLTFQDLYPGLGLVAAGLLLRGYIKYVDHQANAESRREDDDAPDTSPDT